MLCSSCRNKKTDARCPSKALKNLSFCGKHAKMKNPRLWSDINDSKSRHAILIQKIWRGWVMRNMIKTAGPGVLKRSECHNEEDVITCIEKNKVHPLDYFSFKEDGKVFWFDFRSIYQISIDKSQPENPYTRRQISLFDRNRLRDCIRYREYYRKEPLFHDPGYLADPNRVLAMRWTLICQMLEESLFIDLNPMIFLALNRTQLWQFTALLRESLKLWALEKCRSKRTVYYYWIDTCWKRQTMEVASTNQICYYLGACILKILKDCKKPYDLCFKILSARHSL
jgi:hypothetical protein